MRRRITVQKERLLKLLLLLPWSPQKLPKFRIWEEDGERVWQSDFVLRLGASSAALAAAYITGNIEQILPFFTQLFQFHAQYNDLPTLTFFVAANAVAVGYIAFSLPFSIICIIRPHAIGLRLLLVILDTLI